MKKVRVRVPATSANLGPGYDVLGVALSLYNEIELTARWEGPSDELPSVFVDVSGEGAESLPNDSRNIAVQAAREVFKRAGHPGLRFSLRIKNKIPLASGLGSSATACVGAVIAANAVSGDRLSKYELLRLAIELEGHPDNAVPAFMGGLCISLLSPDKQLEYYKLPWPKDLAAVVAIPRMKHPLALKTHAMRAILKPSVPRQDAVFNIGRTALFIACLMRRDFGRLSEAMQDRLHQPVRFREMYRHADPAIKAAKKAGAYGAALSGAGPGIVALAAPKNARAVERALHRSLAGAKTYLLKCDQVGAQIVG